MREDVEDVYRALGGEPLEVGQDETKPVTKEEFAAKLKAEFDLDVDGGCPRQPAASRAACLTPVRMCPLTLRGLGVARAADSVFNSFGKDLKMTDFEGLLMTGDK